MYDFKNVPQELKDMNRWVCFEFVEREGKNKLDKVPINANTGGRAMSNNSDTWSSFENAYDYYKKGTTGGLGIMLGNGLFGVDIDGVNLDDEVTQETLSTLNSYSEISPSGNGIHVYCYGQLPQGRRRKGNFECYDSGRFFTVTGNMIGDINAVYNREEEVKALHDKYVQEEKKEVVKRDFVPLSMSDDEIIEKIRESKQAGSFDALYMYGGGGDHSADDMALCNILAFWCGCNEGQMDSIFRSSALMREKWFERRGAMTYGEKTIKEAVSCCGEVYTPPKPKSEKKKEIEAAVKEETRYQLEYYNEKGKVIPYYLAKHIANSHTIVSDELSMYHYDNGIYGEVKPNAFRFIDEAVWDKQQIKMPLVKEVTGQLESITYDGDFKPTSGYVHFKNGLLNVSTREIERERKDVVSFGKVPYVYNHTKKDITGTVFEKFVVSSLSEDMLPVVQEMIGVCLHPVTDKRAYFYLLHGEGRNGKGVLMDIILNMIPQNLRSSITIAGYDERFINSAIKGKTLNICLDDKTSRLEEIGNFKSVTAGEEVYAEKKGKDGMAIKSILTHISAFNKIPSMNEKANAFFDRMIAIHFKTTFGTAREVEAGQKDMLEDIGMKQYILEHEMENIIAWGMDGLFRLIDNGYVFTINNELSEAKEELRCKVDSVREWSTNNLVMIKEESTVDKMVKAVDLYKRYLEWCGEENLPPQGRNTFYESMKSQYRRNWKESKRTLYFNVLNG